MWDSGWFPDEDVTGAWGDICSNSRSLQSRDLTGRAAVVEEGESEKAEECSGAEAGDWRWINEGRYKSMNLNPHYCGRGWITLEKSGHFTRVEEFDLGFPPGSWEAAQNISIHPFSTWNSKRVQSGRGQWEDSVDTKESGGHALIVSLWALNVFYY